jgi:hypothetical protein
MEPIKQMFTDVLKEYWVILLSIFFVWLSARYGRAMLVGGFRSIEKEVDRQERIQVAADRITESDSLFPAIDVFVGFARQSHDEKWTVGDFLHLQRRLRLRFKLNPFGEHKVVVSGVEDILNKAGRARAFIVGAAGGLFDSESRTDEENRDNLECGYECRDTLEHKREGF